MWADRRRVGRRSARVTRENAGEGWLPSNRSEDQGDASADASAGRKSANAALTKQIQGRHNDRTVLGALAAAGGAMRPGEVAAAAGISPRTARDVVARLEKRGLVLRHGQSRVEVTRAGRAEAGAPLPGLGTVSALDTALDLLPSETLRAFLRLLLSNVIARHHLRGAQPEGWGSHVAVGPTKTGKSALAVICAAVFGLDPVLAIRTVSNETPGALWGRREQGDDGLWTLVASPVLAQPFVCLDEVDKVGRELQRAVHQLMQGRALTPGEGTQVVDVAPTAYLCSNGTVGSIREEYRRRSVVLDTRAIRSQLVDVAPAVRQILRPGVLPVLSLTEHAPPAVELPEKLLVEVVAALRCGLTEEGFSQLDEQAFEKMGLGRAALARCDLRTAAFATVLDYLACAGTVGEASGTTPPAALAAVGNGLPLAPEPGAASAERSTPTSGDLRRQQESVALAARRAEAASALSAEARKLDMRKIPEPYRSEAAGVRKALREWSAHAAASRSAESLAGIEEVAKEAIRKGGEILGRVHEEQRAQEQRRRAEQADRNAAAEASAVNRRETADNQKRYRQAKRELSLLEGRLRDLGRLAARRGPSRGTSPITMLADLQMLDGTPLLRFERDAPAAGGGPVGDWRGALLAVAEGASRVASVRRSGPQRASQPVRFAGHWVAADGRRYRGTRRSCPDLEEWNDVTASVLRPAIEEMARRADELRPFAARAVPARAARSPRAKTTRPK